MSEVVETHEVNGYTVEIVQDADGDGSGNPRDADNLGIMLATGHRRYELGDAKFATDEYRQAAAVLAELVADGRGTEFPAWAKATLGATVVKPLWLLDHSGLSMRTGPFAEDPGSWDSGVVGFIFDTATTRAQIGTPEDRIEACLDAEVKYYDMYLTGDVYGYRVMDPEGNEVDSCWGFLGIDSAVESGKEAAEGQNRPQFVMLRGSINSGVRGVYGPYAEREDAEADAGEHGTVMLLEPAPEATYRLIAPADNERYAGTTITFTLSRTAYRDYLAKGWVLAD